VIHLSLAEADPTHRTVCGADVIMLAVIDPPIGDMGNVKYIGLLLYEGEPQIQTWTDEGRFEKYGTGRTPFDLDLPLREN
jgi:hypothetical protein